MFRESQKNPRAAFQTLQVSVSMSNTRFHESTIGKKLNKCLEGLPGENVSSVEKNMAVQLKFANLDLNKPHDFWTNAVWTDKTKMEMFSNDA